MLDAFLLENAWSRRQQEIVRRCDRDGEAFLRLFRDRDMAEPLSAMEGQYLIRMAVALALANNRQALAKLRERFGPMMRETVNADAFHVLASYVDSGPIDPADLANTVNEIDSYEAFMVSLREQVTSETLTR